VSPGDVLFICVLVVFVAGLLGMILGGKLANEQHREYCDCRQCKSWRRSMAKFAVKREAPDDSGVKGSG
jgi:hypothetical protein